MRGRSVFVFKEQSVDEAFQRYEVFCEGCKCCPGLDVVLSVPSGQTRTDDKVQASSATLCDVTNEVVVNEQFLQRSFHTCCSFTCCRKLLLSNRDCRCKETNYFCTSVFCGFE